MQLVKKLLWWLAFRCGLVCLFRHLNAGKIAVLMYHGVVPDEAIEADGDWLQVSAGEFYRQMQYLKRHYDLCLLDSNPRNNGLGSKRPRAMVTFDDGYANNFLVAFPILRKFDVPAIIFLVTGMVDSEETFWWDRLFLSSRGAIRTGHSSYQELKRCHPAQINERVADILRLEGFPCVYVPPALYRPLRSVEIAELASSGLIEFGSHTHRHEILAHMTDQEAEDTIRKSVEWLESHGLKAGFFAAPNGIYHSDHLSLLKSLGFAAVVGTEEKLWESGGSFYGIPRFGIGRDCSIAEFACAISGFSTWVRDYKSLVAAAVLLLAVAFFIGL